MVIYQTNIKESVSVAEKFETGDPSDLVNTKENLATVTGSIIPISTVTAVDYVTPVRGLATRVAKKPIFHFYLDGVEVPIKDFSITRTISNGVSGRLTTWEGYVLETDVGKTIELTFENPVDGSTYTVIKGILTAVSKTPPDKTLNLEIYGLEYELKNDVYFDSTNLTGVFEFTKTRADLIAKDILNGTNFTLVECPTNEISVKFDYETRWRALKLIAEILGVQLWVDENRGVHLGTQGGTLEPLKILKKEVTTDLESLINKVIVVGGNTGDGKVVIGIAEDADSINTYGLKTHVERVPRIKDKDTATLLAKAYLNRYNALTNEIRVVLPVDTSTIRVKEGMNLSLDGNTYSITSIRFTPETITITATPYFRTPSLLEYIKDKLDSQINSTTSSSTFYNESPELIVLYEKLDLDPAYYGGAIAKTVEVDGTEYTILNVMHVYIPDTFTISGGELRIRWIGDESPISFKIVVNGMLYNINSDGTATDGDYLYHVDILADSLKTGWNDIYFVQ